MKICYIGHYYLPFKVLNELGYTISSYFYEPGKSPSKLLNLVKSLEVPSYQISSKLDLSKYTDVFKTCDFGFIASFGIIIPNSILNLPKFGFVNLHPSYLPYYRGRHPLPWMIYNREYEMGVSLHEVTSSIDEGKIYGRVKVPIDYHRNYRFNEDRLLSVVPTFLEGALYRFLNGGGFIPLEEGTYFKPMPRDELLTIINSDTLYSALKSLGRL